MFPTDSFDFSGNYAFVTNQWSMHRLDESVRPLLEARGGRIWRINTEHGRAEALSGRDFSHRSLPPNFWESHAVRAVFTIDNYVPPDVVPPHIPVIALPHAFWRARPQEVSSLLNGYASYLGNTDYYLSLGNISPLSIRPASLRRRDHVYILPFGNLKMDEMRLRSLAEPQANSIVYCCGYVGRSISLEEKFALVSACLHRFPQHIVHLRPFPGDRRHYAFMEEAFRATGRFRIDSSRSTLRHLPSAGAVLCDWNTSVGFLYSVATGHPCVLLTADKLPWFGKEVDGFLSARSPEELIRILERLLETKEEQPGLTALREALVYRPGHSRELFYRYLAQILSGRVPEEALAQPCEYIGDLSFGSASEELGFFLTILRQCRVECHYYLLAWRSSRITALMDFYTQVISRRQNAQPAIIVLQRGEGGGRLILDTKCCAPFFCPAPPEAYLPETREFLRRNEALRLAAEPEEGDARILLPDADKALFCATLADCLERVHGCRGAAVAHNVTQ